MKPVNSYAAEHLLQRTRPNGGFDYHPIVSGPGR
jgi:hypothetical protein